jgi:hypothetical protein
MNFCHRFSIFLRKMLVYALAIGVVAMGSSVSASASVSASDIDSTAAATTASIPLSRAYQMHPLEDPTSWDLHMGRRKAQQKQQQADTYSHGPTRGRFLQKAAAATASISTSARTSGSTFDAEDRDNDDDENGDDNENDDDVWILPFTVEHKKPKNHIPFAGGDTTHGIMIDAGSVSIVRFIYLFHNAWLKTRHRVALPNPLNIACHRIDCAFDPSPTCVFLFCSVVLDIFRNFPFCIASNNADKTITHYTNTNRSAARNKTSHI